jgi:hypothetical protein
VGLTVELLKRRGPARLDEPRIELNPEDDRDWWVAIPVWFKGGVEDVVALDKEILTEFTACVPAAERERIIIDLHID